LRDCFPKDKTTPITIEHGKMLAAWCNAAGKPAATTAAPKSNEVATLKKILWDATKEIHQGQKDVLRQFLTDDCGLDPSKTLEDLTAPELIAITKTAKSKL
jgi:hypothetical protein